MSRSASRWRARRRFIYTTNAIESLNMSLRKAIKTRGAFPSEDAALKVMYLALRNLAARWKHIQGWREALNRFVLLWEARFPQPHDTSTNYLQPDRLHKILDTTFDGIVRANRKRRHTLARKRFQTGTVRLRTDRGPAYLAGRYWA